MLLLAVAASAAAGAVVIVVHGRGAGGEADDGSAAAGRFVCPMHPEVRAAAPSTCPICRMALEPARGGPELARPHAAMEAMADVTAVENIRKHNILEFVHSRSLLLPVSELRGAAWVPAPGEDLAGSPAAPGTIAAVFYDDQLPSIASDDTGTFSPGDAPTTTVAVRRTPDPPRRWDASTSVITFREVSDTSRHTSREVSDTSRRASREVSDTSHGVLTSHGVSDTPASGGRTGAALRVGEVGWVEFPRKRRVVLTVPASAVVQSPDGPYVLVVHPGWRFEKRPIEIGETFLKYGFAVVLSGVSLQERVVARATFFVDADRRLAAGPGAPAQGSAEAMP